MVSRSNRQGGERLPLRRRLIVNPGLQARAQVPLLVFLGVYALLLGGLLFVPLHRKVAQEPDLGVRAILQAQLTDLHLHVWPLLGVAGLLALTVGLRWSLRVAGPLYRLHRALLELVAQGESKPLRFRRNDECRFLEEDIARLNQKLKMMGSGNREVLLAIHAHLKKLAARLDADEIIPRADLEEAIYSMLAQVERVPEVNSSDHP